MLIIVSNSQWQKHKILTKLSVWDDLLSSTEHRRYLKKMYVFCPYSGYFIGKRKKGWNHFYCGPQKKEIHTGFEQNEDK